MTIYVDGPITTATGKFKGWHHMWSDVSTDELNLFADMLGLRRSWLQCSRGLYIKEFWHYDISPAMYTKALRMGATFITLRDYIARVAAQQAAARPEATQL